ncbi:MAG: alpha/beta fold hydrolase [Defluviitaleaceae bacterium]|nr:alpha/beta fold hydrolase [Defluviitaleaceae bacterium]
MRKSTKVLLGLGALIATPIIINHVIAKKAQLRIESKAKENVYEWEYGDIRYVTAGAGKPLLLLHGIYPGASNLEWKAAIKHLSQDYKVYAPDLLGFGYSSKPALDYSAYLYVRLIKDFAENVIGEPVTAAASLHTAAALVSCVALNPEDFEKIILISPTGLEADVALAQDEDGILKKVLESPILGTSVYNAIVSKKALEEIFEEEGLAEFLDEELLDEIYLAAHAEGAAGKHAVSALLAKFFNVDIKENLASLDVPNHIIRGEYLPNNSNFNIWNGIDEAYVVHTVEDTGLLPHQENAEKFCAVFKNL